MIFITPNFGAKMFALRLSALIALIFITAIRPAVAGDVIMVFAASSLQSVLDGLHPVLNEQNLTISAVYASSATLARQIENGAGADVYLTANSKWMDDLESLGLIDSTTRTPVASNRLALISNQELDLAATLGAIKNALKESRLAIADPGSVPAGEYAKQALISTQQWDAVKDHLAPTKDVTGALMLVARGEAPLGIVYGSDVGRTPDIKSSALFPPNTHSPIVYQIAAIKGHTSPGVLHFLKLLNGPDGTKAFQDAGFGAKP